MPGILNFIKRLWRRLGGGKPAPEVGGVSNTDDNSRRVQDSGEKRVHNRPEINEKARNPVGSKSIAIIGHTGSGMSQFIHDATGEYSHGVAPISSLAQYTTKITPVTARIGEKEVTLIDTPGFVYSSSGEPKIGNGALENLVRWINRNGVKLDGIIYMHNIQNKEIYGSTFRPPPELVESCGYSKLIFVTSHWDELDLKEGEGRERKFEKEYWRFMIEKGSPTKRYGGPGDGRAREILELLW